MPAPLRSIRSNSFSDMTQDRPALCPCCGRSLPSIGDRIAVRLQELESACQNHGYLLTPDGRVREEIAAELLGLAPGTLRNWSYSETPLPFTKVARRRTYRLADIAALLEEK